MEPETKAATSKKAVTTELKKPEIPFLKSLATTKSTYERKVNDLKTPHLSPEDRQTISEGLAKMAQLFAKLAKAALSQEVTAMPAPTIARSSPTQPGA